MEEELSCQVPLAITQTGEGKKVVVIVSGPDHRGVYTVKVGDRLMQRIRIQLTPINDLAKELLGG